MPDPDPPLEESVRIDAPPADVWAVVSDLPRMGEWSPDKAFGAVFLGGDIDHDEEPRAGMRTTLARI